ncbi:MAG: hypothetical protein HYY31_03230, partial [Chloroflexi bacterium]|nr:hypothetical protein [Chloroflexota bacterium]
MKSLRLVVLLVGVLSLTITGCSLSRGSATPQYRTESVAKGTLQVSVAASGTTVFPNVAKLTFGS